MAGTGFSLGVDYFGLVALNADALVVLNSSESKSTNSAEATNGNGDIVARQIYGENATPSCDYALKGAGISKWVPLGTVKTTGEDAYILKGVTVSLSAGAAPTVKLDGQLVEGGAATGRTFALDFGALLPKCRIQDLVASCYTLTGEGCYVNKAEYSAQCNIATATKTGSVIAHCPFGGYEEVSLTIVQTGSAVPVLAGGTGWDVVSPLTQTANDTAYVEWTCKLRKSLTATEAA